MIEGEMSEVDMKMSLHIKNGGDAIKVSKLFEGGGGDSID